MPVSTSAHLTTAIHFIVGVQPQSVLDVGCGFGTWGFLCREHLDVFNGRVWPKDWKIRIDAIELFEPYIQAHQRALYNDIRIADIREASKDCGHYDLIIAGDVIEHLEKEEGEAVLERLYLQADKALLVNIPLGPGWMNHPEQYDNPGELHRSMWEDWEFAPYNPQIVNLPHACGDYGCVLCQAHLPLKTRLNGFLYLAEQWEKRGDTPAAVRALTRALAIAPECEEATLYMADLLVRQGKAREALSILANTLIANPNATTIATMHQKLRNALNL